MDMSGADSSLSSLRTTRRDSERLLAILLLSLILHLLFWGAYEAGQKYGWWKKVHWPVWFHNPPKVEALVAQPEKPQEEPLQFVTVDDVATEAPKNAKYYSSQNSRAADQTGQKDTDQPKLEGHQTDALHLTDTLHPQFTDPKPLQPKPSQDEKTVKAAEVPGDLTLGQPQPEQPPRPRTLAQARAQQQRQTPGIMSRLDAGTRRQAVRSSLDAIGTPFGAYDAEVVDAVTQYWYDELDREKFAQDRSGKVTLQFKLNYDGTVTEVQELQNTVGFELGLLCQDAITGPAPFAKWTPEMRQMIGANFRVITFTFYYY